MTAGTLYTYPAKIRFVAQYAKSNINVASNFVFEKLIKQKSS